MNWEAVGAIGEVAGAIGVIGSLLYLAAQIRISNRNFRIESARSIMSNFHGNSWDMAKDAELRRITMSALTNYASLSPEDSSAFDLLMWRYLGNAADALKLRQQGLLDEESFESVMTSLLVTIRSAPKWWEAESKSHVITPSLLEYIEKRLETEDALTWGEQHENWTKVGGT
jgi:hypothetical protein